jgi:hypothetical protein
MLRVLNYSHNNDVKVRVNSVIVPAFALFCTPLPDSGSLNDTQEIYN